MDEVCYYTKPRFFRYRTKQDPPQLRTAAKPHEQGECMGDGQATVTKMVNGAKRMLCLGCLGRTDA